jgi:hypothetical protein
MWGVRMYYLAGVPDIGDPFDVEAFIAAVDIEIPDSENAFVEYREAARRFIPVYNYLDYSRHQLFEDRLYGCEPIERAEVPQGYKKWLARHEQQLQIWRRGTAKPDAREIRLTEQDSTSRYIRGDLLGFGTLAIVNGLRLESEGEPQEAREWYYAAYRCSRHLGGWQGQELYARATSALIRWAQNPTVSGSMLRSCLRGIQREYTVTLPPSHAWKVHYIVMQNTIRRDPDEFFNYRLQNRHKLALFLRGEPRLRERLHRLETANILAHVDKPRRNSPKGVPSTRLYADTDAEFSPTKLGELLSDPAYGGGAYSGDEPMGAGSSRWFEQAKQAALEIALAVQLRYRETNSCPESPQDIIGDALCDWPNDPFALELAPMKYQLHAKEVMIWSVGANGKDDGGISGERNGMKDLVWTISLDQEDPP